MTVRPWLLGCIAVAMIACGKNNGGGVDGNGGDGPLGGDGGLPGLDGPFNGMCAAGNPQCSNCIDDDHDGFIDGFDPECTGPADNDEATFATGIPGDNIDSKNQDCFFDGNSGAGDDGCNVQTCCLLGITVDSQCPQALGGNQYHHIDCPPPIGTGTISQMCIDTCGKLAPPGCDCFGCCTICDPATNMCYDIEINPAVSPNCTSTTLSDPTKCLRCTKNTLCGNSTCGGTTCILCPGEPITDLPPSCNGMNACPMSEQSCASGQTCPAGTYCSNSCCIGVIL